MYRFQIKGHLSGASELDPLFRFTTDANIDKKVKKSVLEKVKNVALEIERIEKLAGLKYPKYYIEPILTVADSTDNVGGIGVLYARTIPVPVNDQVDIIVELTAPLVMFATKGTLRIVLAHEFLHYVELVRSFSRLDLVSQTATSSLYEETYSDYSRAVDPSKIFSNKKLVNDLKKKTSVGLSDDKLNEKCRTKWLEKGLPVVKIPLAKNQLNVPVESVVRSHFDPKLLEIVKKWD